MSREAIAEFQIVTNMYDITQGRSTGVQVQAVSRVGHQRLRGSTFGFFRSDKFNEADPVAKGVVLPYSDQQAGFTLGGPIDPRQGALLRRRTNTSANPSTAVLTPTALPNQTWSLPANKRAEELPGRVATISISPRTTSASACSAGRSTARSRSRAARRIRWPSTSAHASTRPTSRHLDPSVSER